MPDPALSAAFQEAYASAPVDQVIYRTLELWHPAFSAAIRVMRDFIAIDARIEAGAARDAAAVVTFVAFAFDIVAPDQTTSGVPQCVIEIDNVSREILAQIDLAVVSAEQIKAICRAYLSDAFTAALPGAATGMADQITALPFAGDASVLGVALWGVSLAFRYRASSRPQSTVRVRKLWWRATMGRLVRFTRANLSPARHSFAAICSIRALPPMRTIENGARVCG